jgi:hypothetical protein
LPEELFIVEQEDTILNGVHTEDIQVKEDDDKEAGAMVEGKDKTN